MNITSIGGRLGVPHLVPYSASKFAALGFSQGLRAEERRHGVVVTSVVPGLMRTGSPRNATFRGKHRAEYAWFSIADNLPGITIDVEEAALIDGCSPLGVLVRIVIPIAAPGLVVAAIFAFLVSWNEFLFALILSGVEAKTLPVVIAGLNTDVGPLYGEMSAAAVMVMLPNIVMTVALQRFLVRGLTLGAVKG